MKNFWRLLFKILISVYLIFLHLAAALYIYEKINFYQTEFAKIDRDTVESPLSGEKSPTPLPLPTFSENIEPAETPEITSQPPTEYPSDTLMIPVKGVKREQLQDTFNDSRSEGRTHNALDIMAPLGTPVVAAADGEIAKFFDSQMGGITIYQYSADKKLIYYYAHLQKRADNLREKDFVKRGDVIGFVGDTGNAGEGNYHLHFSVYEIQSPERYWEGNNINPFELLKNGIESN
jgi:murein DD-endopeptidase MepM/ murein hydrolase activator NlpD